MKTREVKQIEPSKTPHNTDVKYTIRIPLKPLKVLVDKFGISGIDTVDEDIKTFLS